MNAATSARPSARVRTAAVRGLLAGATIVLLGTAVSAPRSAVGGIAALAVTVGAAAAAWTGVRRRAHRPGEVPWAALTVTLAALAAVVQGIEWSTGAPAGASIADVVRLAGYGTLAAMALRGTVGGRRRPGALLQASLDGCAALAVALLAVLRSDAGERLAAQGHDLLDRVVWLGQPVLGAILVGLVAWRVVLDGRVRRAALLGLLGSCCWLAADAGRLWAVTSGADSGWPRAAHLTGVLLLALVPWTRSTPVNEAGHRPPGHDWWRMTLNVVPFTVPAALELADWARGSQVDPVPALCVYGLLLALGTVRTRVLALDAERAWAAVRSQARRSEALAVHSSDAVAVVAPDGRLTGDSRSLSWLLGCSAPAGADLADLLADVGVARAAVHAALADARRHPGSPTELELEGRTAHGPLWLAGRAVDLCADPDVVGVLVGLYDVTRRKLAEQELAHQALHDSLTGLANRRLFLDRVEQALLRAARRGGVPVVLCLDLDGFKDVNDSLGHLAGDALLRVVAGRLSAAVRAGDTVARLGGDEFAVLLEETSGGPAAAERLAERLLGVLRERIELDGQSVTVGVSIGVVPAEPGSTPLSLLQDGDIAMYRAKAAGRRQWVTFTPDMRATALERIRLERELSTALARRQLHLVYQPVVDLRTDEVVGFEALVRWQHPTLGAVEPDRFIPVAESSGLVEPLGRWVLAEAVRTAGRWQRAHAHHRPLSMAVNVSARQLASESFLDDVTSALAAGGVTPSSLVLEVTRRHW